MRTVYFDHSATTPVHPKVAEEMYSYLTEHYGNPSSFHSPGRVARKAVETAREKVAAALGARPDEIVFTSGGTESINMAIMGAARARRKKGNHIITCAVEHQASLYTCQALGKEGFTLTVLPVDKYGMVSVEQVREAITDQTVLINIIHAQNEVGTIQPVDEIGALAREKGIPFHSDACHSVGRLPVDVNKTGVDLMSFAAHKFNGPMGAGGMYIRKGTRWQRLMYGGSQENRRRVGTENVPAIIGLGVALELALADREKDAAYFTLLRDRLIEGVLSRIPNCILTGHPSIRVPNLASFCFEFVEGESILLSLDGKKIAVSSGSACTSRLLEPSHVLLAMGVPVDVAQSSIRVSLGLGNTEEDVDYFLTELPPIIERLRAMSPLFGCEDEECSEGEDCFACTAKR
ncbi:MAG TPA: aminotransferase class V-fold PLP-dependent enzyme [Spirochaetia bacterium]|nr:aminotransferase class V-fold PLP-dependent enzyme [Spirochaetia bacterium]